MLLGLLILERSCPCQKPAYVNIELEELLFIVGIESQLYNLSLKHIGDFLAFILGFRFFEVSHKLSTFKEFLPELCPNESFIELKRQNPVQVFVSREILDLFRWREQLTIGKIIFSKLIDSVTNHQVEKYCAVELNGWFLRLLLQHMSISIPH